MYEIALRDNSVYIISDKQIEYWQHTFTDVNVELELSALKELWTTNAIPRKSEKTIEKFICKHLYEMSNLDK